MLLFLLFLLYRHEALAVTQGYLTQCIHPIISGFGWCSTNRHLREMGEEIFDALSQLRLVGINEITGNAEKNSQTSSHIFFWASLKLEVNPPFFHIQGSPNSCCPIDADYMEFFAQPRNDLSETLNCSS